MNQVWTPSEQRFGLFGIGKAGFDQLPLPSPFGKLFSVFAHAFTHFFARLLFRIASHSFTS